MGGHHTQLHAFVSRSLSFVLPSPWMCVLDVIKYGQLILKLVVGLGRVIMIHKGRGEGG